MTDEQRECLREVYRFILTLLVESDTPDSVIEAKSGVSSESVETD